MVILKNSRACGACALVPALMRQRQKHLCESEALLGHRAYSRTARATEKTCLKKPKQKKKENSRANCKLDQSGSK